MNSTLAKELKTWKISYNPYIDLFQIFTEQAFYIPEKKVSTQHKGSATLLFNKANERLLLIELKNAYDVLGDVDNMSKADIIDRVIGYVENYGR